LPQTATRIRRRRAAVARRLYNPAYNIRLGCAYLRSVLKNFGGIPEQALAAYNAGDLRVREWLNRYQFREAAEFAETIPFRETISYVQTVLRDAEIYRQLITGEARFARCEIGNAAKASASPARVSKPASAPKKKRKRSRG
jgi:soluble lytic murein transglycosylase